MTTRLIVVGKNRGGVGGTTVARLLTEYRDSSSWRVFDGQAPGGSLRRFVRAAEVVDFHSTAGRMRVLDSLADRATFIDLPAGLLSETLQMLRDVGMLADVAAQRIKLTVFHVLGPSVDSMGEAADVAARLAEGGDHVVVRNAANNEKFQYDDAAFGRFLEHVEPAAAFDLPHLDGAAYEAVDASGMPFSKYDGVMPNGERSDFIRRTVDKWRSDCFEAMTKARASEYL